MKKPSTIGCLLFLLSIKFATAHTQGKTPYNQYEPVTPVILLLILTLGIIITYFKLKNKIPDWNKPDWKILPLYLLLAIGGLQDEWAHRHVINTFETFFTEWHIILYTGYLAILGYLLYRISIAKGTLRKRIPTGYGYALIGAGIFLISGFWDGTWHTLWGFEEGFDKFVSIPHILLVTSAGMIFSGPLLSFKNNDKSRISAIPALISITLIFSSICFITDYHHPIVEEWAVEQPVESDYYSKALVMLGIQFYSLLLIITVAILKKLPSLPGMFTIFLGLHGILLSIPEATYSYIPVFLLTGLLTDLSSKKIITSVSSFALIYSIYILVQGTWLNLHMLTGIIAMPVLFSCLAEILTINYKNHNNT